MEKRFRALRFIGTLFKVLAWITLVGAIIVALFFVIGGASSGLSSNSDQLIPGLALQGALAGIIGGLGVIIGGLIYFLMLYAVAESIYVILSIEENTRLTAMALSGRVSA
ncbi:MAG: hypothetical protein ACYC5O_20365 [Anaerolineae bacterium]